MPLIESPRFQPGDLAAWQAAAARDLVWADTPAYRERVEDAELRLYRWGRDKDFYAGTSWGKDSMALAHMLAQYLPGKPLVWIRVEPIKNPECLLVRDEFLRRFPAVRYDEITVHCRIDADGVPHATGTLEAGFAEAARRHGENHISGIRRHEAAGREKHYRASGGETDRTLAPLIRWTGDDVFAYLAQHDLPVHPVYAMSMGGVIDRSKLRVASLRGRSGTGMGRREWEDLYYPEFMKWT